MGYPATREGQSIHQSFYSFSKITETEMVNREMTVTLGGPLKSWIFSSMSRIQPCISSGESVCREEAPGDKALQSCCGSSFF